MILQHTFKASVLPQLQARSRWGFGHTHTPAEIWLPNAVISVAATPLQEVLQASLHQQEE